MSLISCNQKIDNIHFVELDHRPKKAVCALRVDDITLIKFEDGSFYSSRPHRMGEFAYLPGMSGWTRGLLKALRALKVINTADINEHLAQCKRNDERTARRYSRESLMKMAAEHGFEISEEQKKKLRFDEEK